MFQKGRGFPQHALIALGALLCAAAFYPARAATICVSSTGASGCQATISAAVAAAAPGDVIQVGPGTYKETVHITIDGIALIGAGSATTIIDATGLPNGINIDGSGSKNGLYIVIVSGFTVENANLQGILVQNAAGVTISQNQVLNNDQSLTLGAHGPTCPGIPDVFKAGEDFDCGEGIHLVGVVHSVVSNNVVQKNAGGILLSDDTGPTVSNVISGNLVSDNAKDCGITLASHSGMGIIRNTISGNQSLRNGLQGGGGGVGIFAPGPGSVATGNVVINNTLMGNELPGVAMHNHAAPGVGGVPAGLPPVNFTNNMIIGNIISGNGADFEDAATPGTAGINIASLVPTNTIVSQNIISQENIGVAVRGPGAILVALNNFSTPAGVNDLGGGGFVDATQNWWGCPAGPPSGGCALALGNVAFAAALTAPFSASQLPSPPSPPPPTPTGTITFVVAGFGGQISSTNTFQTSTSQVSLNASGSSSSNGGTLSYSWTVLPGSSAVSISGANTATPFFQLSSRGTYQFQLTVTDSTGLTASATVTILFAQ